MRQHPQQPSQRSRCEGVAPAVRGSSVPLYQVLEPQSSWKEGGGDKWRPLSGGSKDRALELL